MLPVVGNELEFKVELAGRPDVPGLQIVRHFRQQLRLRFNPVLP